MACFEVLAYGCKPQLRRLAQTPPHAVALQSLSLDAIELQFLGTRPQTVSELAESLCFPPPFDFIVRQAFVRVNRAGPGVAVEMSIVSIFDALRLADTPAGTAAPTTATTPLPYSQQLADEKSDESEAESGDETDADIEDAAVEGEDAAVDSPFHEDEAAVDL